MTYPTDNTSDGGNALVWVLVGGLLLIVAGGLIALVSYQKKRRRMEMRAAQRRAQAARAAQQRPYARQAGANGQPRTGAYPNQNTVRRPTAQEGQPTSQYSPYGSYYRSQENPYARPERTETESQADPFGFDTPDATARPTGRVGRRSAYRQAQEQDDSEE